MIELTGAKVGRRALPLLLVVAAFGSAGANGTSKALLLATTTSTQDSGLLDVLVPAFEKQSGLSVKTIAVGSGQAIALAQRGEVDVLLVHSPDAEEAFMAAGAGRNRRPVMHNDFVLVGPPNDPAGVKSANRVEDALRAVQAKGAVFVSRGDKSGTHSAELKLWRAAGVKPEGEKWYQSTGLGMGQTLNVAAEKRGYALTDRGTYLALQRNLDLAILREGDASLLNGYHVIEVNPAKHPKVNAAGARAFSDFLVAAPAQKLIAEFGVAKYGGPLFFSDAAAKTEPAQTR